jgi:hypothetical protein
LRLYVDALMKGNPLAVGVTVIGAVALSVGPFYEGLSSRDPAAIGIVVLILLGIFILLTLAIVDRKLNPPQDKGKSKSKGRSTRR